MRFQITVCDEAMEAEFDSGVVTVGSGEDDAIALPGLRPAQLELRIEDERLMVVSAETFTIDDVLSPAHVPRLVLAGERIGLADGVFLRQVGGMPAAEAGTSAVLKHLLSDATGPEQVRCAHLIALTGLDVGRSFPLVGDEVDVGRGERMAVRLRDRAVSRRHARLLLTGSGYVLEDLASPNGIFVNGRRVEQPTPLTDGDVLELGRSILRFHAAVSAAEEPASAIPAEAPGAAAPVTDTPSDVPDAQPDADSAPDRRSHRWVEGALMTIGLGLAGAGVAFTYRML